MMSLPPSVQIFLCTQFVDGRKGIDSLAAMVQSVLEQNPLSGHLFVFLASVRSRAGPSNSLGKCIRMLYWDTDGYFLAVKRLIHGRVRLPVSRPNGQTKMRIEDSDLRLLLRGVDFSQIPRRARWHEAA